MKFFLYLIFFLITLSPSYIFPQELTLLTGRIHSIYKDKNIVTLILNNDCCKNIMSSDVNNDENERLISVIIEDSKILEKITINEYYRIWVYYSGENNTFIAKSVTIPGRCLGGIDQTGIRKRLEKSNPSCPCNPCR